MSRVRMTCQYGLFAYIFASSMYGWYTICKKLAEFLTTRTFRKN